MERQAVAKVQRTPTGNNHLHRQSPASSLAGHPLLELQRSIGNQAVQRLIRSPYIQTKLQVSTPGDPFEQEADRVADTVMRMTEPEATEEETPQVQAKPLATQITPLVQREPEQPIEEEQEKTVAAKFISHSRVPLAVREDDDEEKVAPKLDTAPSPQEQEQEKTVQTKSVNDTPLQQHREDEEEKKEKLEATPSIQRQVTEEGEDKDEVQTKRLSSQFSRPPCSSASARCSGDCSVQRLCTNCAEEKEQGGEMVQRKAKPEQFEKDDELKEQPVQSKPTQAPTPSSTTSVAANIQALKGSGTPLPDTTRAFFEPRFGADFSQVRAHTGLRATATAAALQARAFTFGQHIVFGSGEYAPDSHEGRHLLAHELTHVRQQGGEGWLRRDAVPAPAGKPAPDAGSSTPAPPLVKGYKDTFKGVTISESKEQDVYALKEEVAKKGIAAADQFLLGLEDYAGPGLESARKFKKEYEADPSGISGGVPESETEIQRREKVRDVLLPVVREAVADVNAQSTKTISDFKQVMKDNALQTLAASKARAEAERVRYGITTKKETRSRSVGKAGTVTDTVTTHSIADTQSPAVKGMREAAKLLLARRYVLRAKDQEVSKQIVCAQGACGTGPEHARLAGEFDTLRKDYRKLQQQISFEYPILDRMSAIDEKYSLTENAIGALTDLERVANSKSETELATTTGEQIEETLEKNERARQGVEADNVNLWRLKVVFELSKAQAGVDADPFRKKLIEDRWQFEQPHPINEILEALALLLLNIGAIVLAAPTGGASLAIAFGVNAAVAAKHTSEYLLDKALAGSDLLRAQALTQDDPSFVWLAIEILGVGLDAASALAAIRAMRPVVKAAQIASKDGKLTAEAIGSINNAAKPFEKPQLAENVIKKLPKGNTAVLEAIAPASEREIGQYARATRAIEAEAAETLGPSVRSTVGTEVKISKAGHIFTCSSPCQVLREKYAAILGSGTKLEGEATTLEMQLVELEKRAIKAAEEAKLATTAEDIVKTKRGAEALEKEIAAFEQKLAREAGYASALKKISGLEPAVSAKITQLDRDAISRLGALEPDQIAKLSKLELDGLKKLAALPEGALRNLAQLDEASLRALGQMDAAALKRLENAEIVNPASRVGSGEPWRGSGGAPKWAKPEAKPYRHVVASHGAQLRSNQAAVWEWVKRFKRPQGIWRDNRLIVEAEKLAPPFEGQYIIDMGKDIGDVFELDGKTITRAVTKFFLRRNADGTLVSAYPISASFTGW